jgi:hypothetical protein
MKLLVETFLKPSFGEMDDVVRIATAKLPIFFRGPVRDPDYTSAADVNGNLP